MASTENVKVIIDGVNNTKSAFSGATKNVNGFTDRLEKARGTLTGLAVGGAAAFGGIAYGIKQATDAAGQAKLIGSNFETTFGKSSDAVGKFTKDFGNKFGFVKSELQDSANSIGFQLNAIDGLTTEATTNITTSLLKSAGGLSDFFGETVSVKRASDAMAKAIAGNTASLIDMGFNVREGELAQAAYKKGIAATGEELTKQQRIQALQAVIVDQTSGSVKGLTKNLDSYVAQQRFAHKAQVELNQAIGKAFLPLMTQVYKAIIPLIEKFSKWAKENPVLVKTLGAIAVIMAAVTAAVGLLGLAVLGLSKSYQTLSPSILGATRRLKTWYLYLKTTTVTTFAKSIGLKLRGAFVGATAATTGFTGALRIMKGVLMATGIGLLAVAVGVTISKFLELKDTVGSFGNAFEFVWEQIKKVFYNTLSSIYSGLAKLFEFLHLDKTKKDLQETASALNLNATSASIAQDKILKMGRTQQTQNEQITKSFQVSKAELDKFIGGLDTGAVVAEKASKSMTDSFEKVIDSVKEINSQIKDVYNTMSQNTKSFEQTQADEKNSYQNEVVAKVAESKNKIKQLEDELDNAREQNSKNDVQRIKDKIRAQRQIVREYSSWDINLDKQIAEQRKYLRMNELEQIKYKHEQQKLLNQKEYLQEQIQSLKKLLRLKNEQQQIFAMMTAEQNKRLQTELAKTQSFRDGLTKRREALGTWMDNTKGMYDKFVREINRKLSTIKTPSTGKGIEHRATGGSVNGGQSYLVGERGAELFTPGSNGSIIPNNRLSRSGGTTIILQGNTLLDSEAGEKIGNDIMKALKRENQLSLG